MSNLPSFTKNFYRDPYPAISPTRPELSAAGKVVIVTGGAGYIGKALCKAFVHAQAQDVILLDLNDASLQKAKAEIEKEGKSNVHTFVADITDAALIRQTVEKIASSIGKIDVLVNNAGYQPKLKHFRDADLNEWWKGFDINVKGSFNIIQAFLHHAAPHATLVNIASIVAHWGIRQGYLKGQTSYSAAKIAMARVMELLQDEEPDLRVFNIHPGLIASQMAVQSGTLEWSLDHGIVFSPLL